MAQLTVSDLIWYFCVAPSEMGVRSTHGAFVDMAMSGIQSGGRENGVEARAVEDWRLFAVRRHRRIHAVLTGAPPAQAAILEAAYGPNDWARHLPPVVRLAVRQLLGELVQLGPLTAMAQRRAEQRQAPEEPPCASAEEARSRAEVHFHASEIVATDIATREPVIRETGVRCAYRPADNRKCPPRKKDRPSGQGRRRETPAGAKEALFQRDPALAGSARGAVIDVACSEDKGRKKGLAAEAQALLADAHREVGVVPPGEPRRERAVTTRVEERRDA